MYRWKNLIWVVCVAVPLYLVYSGFVQEQTPDEFKNDFLSYVAGFRLAKKFLRVPVPLSCN